MHWTYLGIRGPPQNTRKEGRCFCSYEAETPSKGKTRNGGEITPLPSPGSAGTCSRVTLRFYRAKQATASKQWEEEKGALAWQLLGDQMPQLGTPMARCAVTTSFPTQGSSRRHRVQEAPASPLEVAAKGKSPAAFTPTGICFQAGKRLHGKARCCLPQVWISGW